MKEYKFEEMKELRYGENPHQYAWLYRHDDMADYEVLFDKELSYDNVLNLDEITKLLSEFFDVNAVAIMKHGNCCGFALGENLEDAYKKAFDYDPVSAFYGTIGFTKTVGVEIAKHVCSMGVKVLVAPDFEKDALEILQDSENLKLVKLNTPLQNFRKLCTEEVHITPFGVMIQNKNDSNLDKDLFKVVTKTKPTTEQIEDAIFAWKIVKHAKTDSAVIANNFKVLGISQGQSNATLAVENAINLACDGTKDAILATDGIIYSQDIVFAAAQGRISLIIQTGGSYKDKQIIELADKYGISMIMTGIRNHKY